MIAALLLAAGSSRRFGAPKLLQDIEGRTLIYWSAARLLGLPPVELIVVAPPEHEEIARALSGLRARLVVNPDAAEGMGSSIATGVAHLSPSTQAVILALADSPPDPAVLRRLVERYRDGGAAIVTPSHGGVIAPPVLFDRSVFGELCALTGDHGARRVVERLPGRVARIDLDGALPIDVDTPEDLARLRREVHFTGS